MNSVSKREIIILSLIPLIALIGISASAEENSMPSWIKKTAAFWAEDKISDSEFVKALEYLISKDIIQVPSTAADTIDTESNQELWFSVNNLQNQVDELKVQVSNLKKDLDKANNRIESLENQVITSTSNTPRSTPTSQPTPTKLQDPQKTLAYQWYEGDISESQFLEGIQKLINQGVIAPFGGIQTKSASSESVPNWIKNGAGWWSEDKLDDEHWESILQYLYNNGFLHNPS